MDIALNKYLLGKSMHLLSSQDSALPTTFSSKHLSFKRTDIWLSHHSANTTAVRRLCLCISWSLPQMLFRHSFIHSPNKYLLSAIPTHPVNSNSLFMSVIFSEKRFEPFSSKVMFSRPWSFGPSALGLFSLNCSLSTYLSFSLHHWVHTEQKDHHLAQIHGKVCCRYIFLLSA